MKKPVDTVCKLWYVYIVRCSDQTLYTGISIDVQKRLNSHNRGKGAKYTQSRLPVFLVYTEISLDKSTALKREIQIKRLSKAKKEELINVGKT